MHWIPILLVLLLYMFRAERLPETCRVLIPIKLELNASVSIIHKTRIDIFNKDYCWLVNGNKNADSNKGTKFTEFLTHFPAQDTGLHNISLCVCQHENMSNPQADIYESWHNITTLCVWPILFMCILNFPFIHKHQR